MKSTLITIAIISSLLLSNSSASVIEIPQMNVLATIYHESAYFLESVKAIVQAIPQVSGPAPWFSNLIAIQLWPTLMKYCIVWGFFQVLFTGNVGLYYNCHNTVT